MIAKKYIRIGLVLMFILALSIMVHIYHDIDPMSSAWFPKCPFLMITGLECPGCGSQRTIHAILNGEWGVAFQTNALVAISLPYIFVAIPSALMRKKYLSARFLYEKLTSQKVVWIYLILYLATFIFRNLPD